MIEHKIQAVSTLDDALFLKGYAFLILTQYSLSQSSQF